MIFRASRRLLSSARTSTEHELYPKFFDTPFRYIRWAARERPTFFWSTVVGLAGPVLVIVVPPIQRAMGYKNRPFIPQTYPIPTGPRQIPSGFDDDEESQ